MSTLREMERQLKRQRIATVIVGVVAALALAFTFVDRGRVSADEKEQKPVTRHPVLQAERFELVNEKGELLAALFPHDSTGRPVFGLYDQEGDPRAVITLNEDYHPIITFQDDKDRQRMRMYLNSDFAGRIDMFDEKNHAQVEVEAGEFPHLYMRCGQPYARVMLDTAKDGATLQLKGEDGDNLASIGVDTKGNPALELQDKDGNSLFKKP